MILRGTGTQTPLKLGSWPTRQETHSVCENGVLNVGSWPPPIGVVTPTYWGRDPHLLGSRPPPFGVVTPTYWGRDPSSVGVVTLISRTPRSSVASGVATPALRKPQARDRRRQEGASAQARTTYRCRPDSIDWGRTADFRGRRRRRAAAAAGTCWPTGAPRPRWTGTSSTCTRPRSPSWTSTATAIGRQTNQQTVSGQAGDFR